MSEHKPRKSNENKTPKAYGWMAEYKDEHSLLAAARKVRDSGYTQTDAFTPFPVHGIDEALGIKPTVLPFIVLCAGLTGLTTALVMQYWMNGVDYKYIISAKPMGITPASIPVSFELTVLFSAFTTFFAMIFLNGLPKFSNPVFTNPRFDKATDDKFFLYVNASDKYYNRDSVKELLAGTTPDSLDEVIDDSTESALPRSIILGALLLVVAGLIPGAIILNMRAGYSNLPRLHVWFDMDFQPKKKAQQTTTIFADGRTMRPQVKGSIARGQLDQQDSFYLGYDPAKVTAMIDDSAVKFVTVQPPEEGKPEGEKPAEDKPAGDAPVADTPKSEAPTTQDPPKEEPVKTEPPVAAEKTPEVKPAEATPPAQAPVVADAVKPDAVKEAAKPDAGQAATPAAPPALNLPWLEKLPIEVNNENMKLGRAKFETFCAACHGYAGFGDGLVHKRADALAQGVWIPPTSMHIDRVRNQPVGQIYYTITNGQNKMASYATMLTPKERWAVVLYVKALQRSRNANMDDVPTDQRAKLDAAVAPEKK